MINHPRISELLLETGAYKDLEQPVILTSGELGIYYINTEMLCQDGGKFNDFGDNSQAMIQHAVQMTHEHPTFQEVIDILAEKTKLLLQKKAPIGVSGGQRRDWIFSGPVARQLGLPHFSLYKQEAGKPDRIDRIEPDGSLSDLSLRFGMFDALDFYMIVHIVDLITEGSSVYTTGKGNDSGWVPMLRTRCGEVKDLVAVVTRQQGGEEMLAGKGVTVHPFVAIDEDFLRQHSRNPERAVAYLQNPRQWSEDYLREHGALAFVEAFDPTKGKLDRVHKFVKRYSEVLEQCGKFQELEDAVSSRYGNALSNWR